MSNDETQKQSIVELYEQRPCSTGEDTAIQYFLDD